VSGLAPNRLTSGSLHEAVMAAAPCTADDLQDRTQPERRRQRHRTIRQIVESMSLGKRKLVILPGTPEQAPARQRKFQVASLSIPGN